MNYAETIDYLYTKLPMFTRIGARAIRPDLRNTLVLCKHLHNPQQRFRSIHIAGTNGKGSTSHMLAAILQKAGYKTGLYTSPHLKDFRERIRINGEMISEDAVIDFVEQNKTLFESVEPSFFEMTVALAFEYFWKQKVDVAIIETGLGGRLDSTNVITPRLSVITNISYDHTDLLGDTLAKIAFEKAGIIKPEIPVVIGETNHETNFVFIEKAKEENSPILFANEIYNTVRYDLNESSLILSVENRLEKRTELYETDLTGIYQTKNICTVLASVYELNNSGFQIDESDIREGLKNVKSLTGLRGRWEILSKAPLIIADVAHNEGGLKIAIEQLKEYPCKRLHFVIGFVKDKSLEKILPLFPKDAFYYFCKPDLPRGLEVDVLENLAAEYDLFGKRFSSVKDAFENAKEIANADDIIYVGGSTFVVAEII
jgi:dihydrofolate synthase / folylpolyglutamate synthase